MFYFVFLFFVLVSLFVCLFVFFLGGGGGGRSKENIFLTKIANLKLPFNPQIKYMTFMYQHHINDLLVLFLPQRNSRETVCLRQILNANSNVC